MMRKSLRISLLLLIPAMVGTSKVNAQVDPHFTQYYVYPAWLNPALTGAFDGQYRVSGIYRSQWGNISSPFTTPGFSLEYTTERKKSADKTECLGFACRVTNTKDKKKH